MQTVKIKIYINFLISKTEKWLFFLSLLVPLFETFDVEIIFLLLQVVHHHRSRPDLSDSARRDSRERKVRSKNCFLSLCSCVNCAGNTTICILLAKWGHFWEVRAFWLLLTSSKACGFRVGIELSLGQGWCVIQVKILTKIKLRLCVCVCMYERGTPD